MNKEIKYLDEKTIDNILNVYKEGIFGAEADDSGVMLFELGVKNLFYKFKASEVYRVSSVEALDDISLLGLAIVLNLAPYEINSVNYGNLKADTPLFSEIINLLDNDKIISDFLSIFYNTIYERERLESTIKGLAEGVESNE